MRLLLFLTCYVSLSCAQGIDLATLRSAKSIPPAARIWFQHLARYDIRADEIEKMSSIPGVAPALVELAEALVNQGADFEHLYFVLDAIRLRNDLDESHQAWLRKQLKPLIGRNPSGLTHALKERGLMILSKHPGVENERLLISYLDDHDGDKSKFGFSATAAEGLGQIGTRSALEPLQHYADRIKPLPGHSDHHYDYVIAAVSALKSKIAHEESALPATPSKTPMTQTSSKVEGNDISKSAFLIEAASSMPRSIIFVLIAAVACLLWLVLKRRS